MGRVGVEPTRCFHRRILSPLRLRDPNRLVLRYIRRSLSSGFELVRCVSKF